MVDLISDVDLQFEILLFKIYLGLFYDFDESDIEIIEVIENLRK